MADRPNIVVILADDMGFSDIGCYGGKIETPNLDRLAAGGVRFTQAYNIARCCPARASLLTGLHPHQVGMGWMTAADLGRDAYRGDLNDKCLTIPEALAPAGYRSYMVGKWHLTYSKFMTPEGPKDSWPMQRGFDQFWGTLAGAGGYFSPKTLMAGNDPCEAVEGLYYTDGISDVACDMIGDHDLTSPGKPFFLYAAYTAPHWPLHAKQDDIAKYRGKYRAGWDVLRAEKYQRQREMGLLDESWPLSPRDPKVAAWDSLSAEKQDEFDLRMAIYAAQVDCMDQGIGRIIETLQRRGMLDNTLVVFLSDNGGCHEEVHRGDPDPACFGTARSFESYGREWANYSNVPFREFKSFVHEGGIATPMIAHWPAGITTEAGGFCRDLVHITDIMPTCLELAGAEYPGQTERTVPPLVGESIAPALAGKAPRRGCMFWEHEANRALRDGDWKIVAKGIDGAWELYDLSADRTELNDLAADQPERVEAMSAKWQQIAAECDVLPLDGRRWRDRVNGGT